MGELLNCPFCGSHVDIVSNRDWHRIQGEHDNRCPLADYEFACPATDEDLYSAVAEWNRRTHPQPALDVAAIVWKMDRALVAAFEAGINGEPFDMLTPLDALRDAIASPLQEKE